MIVCKYQVYVTHVKKYFRFCPLSMQPSLQPSFQESTDDEIESLRKIKGIAINNMKSKTQFYLSN